MGALPNEAWRISWKRKFCRLLLAVAGGLLYAASLPPLGWRFCAWGAVAPLAYLLYEDKPWRGAWHGFVFALAWTLPGYWFLREIEAPVPFAIAVAVSCWYGVFGWCFSALRDAALYPAKLRHATYEEKRLYRLKELPFWRQLWYVVGFAALYTVLEWTRSRLFPWNDLAATQYRNLALIQLAAVTGSYGVTFCIAAVGAALFGGIAFPRGWKIAVAVIAAVGLITIGGAVRISTAKPESGTPLKLLLIQGDLSQRRNPKPGSTEEALVVYHTLTRQALQKHPDAELILWPECAIPIVYDSTQDRTQELDTLNGVYQLSMRQYSTPMLIGALDVRKDLSQLDDVSVTNSALLLKRGNVLARYDKCHRVPFGEYVPFRAILPQNVIDAIDMGRDLLPGTSHDPIVLTDALRPGMMICFESVFGYIARKTVQRGANFLVVLSNDAWYPTSSEPEQHLANATLRAVESGVPMVRCGNNGGSLVVTKYGKIENVLTVPGNGRPELRRGRGFALVELNVADRPAKTFYLRFGEWLIALFACGIVLWIFAAVAPQRAWKKQLHDKIYGRK